MNQAFNLSSFGEEMLVHENAMVKVDPDIPLDRAALVGCGVMTGVGAVFNTAKVEPGRAVAVIGCGGVGLSAINGAAHRRRRTHHRDRYGAVEARSGARVGATDMLNVGNADAVEQVKELTQRRRALLVRGARDQAHRRAGLRDAAPGRHRDDYRHGAVRV